MSAPHVLTITEFDPVDGDFEWTTRCPGVTSTCEVWYQCQVVADPERPGWGSCSHTPTEDEEYGEYDAHGERHQWIDGEWMTPAGRCCLGHADVSDDVWEIAHEHGNGEYPVDLDYEGDGDWRLILRPVEVQA